MLIYEYIDHHVVICILCFFIDLAIHLKSYRFKLTPPKLAPWSSFYFLPFVALFSDRAKPISHAPQYTFLFVHLQYTETSFKIVNP